MKKLLLLCLYLLGGLLAYSQPGTLDTTFAGKGWTYTDFTKSNNYIESGLQVLRQADGSYVLLLQAGSSAVLARYRADGTPDRSYGTEGFSEVGNLLPAEAVQQPDGKIVVAGYRNSGAGNIDFTLVRYNVDGSLDRSFGIAGKITTDLGSSDYASALMIQPDGKMVVAGSASGPGGSDFALVRYEPGGALDGSFGTGGKVVTDFGGYDFPVALGLQADGKLVVAGSSFVENDDMFAVARYNNDGSLDLSLDGDGKVTTHIGGGSVAAALGIQGDGKLVVAGFTYGVSENPDTKGDFALARYNRDGSLDNSFDGDGKLVTDFFGDWDYASSLAIQPDGKIVVAGRVGNPGTNSTDFVLVRYGVDGAPDNSFGAQGRVITDLLGQDGVSSVALQEDGKLVVAGTTGYPDSYTSDFALARYNSDGSLDPAFSEDGKLAGYYPVAFSANNALAVQRDGKVVVAGRANRELSDAADFGVARYNVDGSLDLGFGTAGTVVTDFFGNLDELTAIAIQGDGKIVAAGYAIYDSVTGRHGFALARYNGDGTPDPSFGGDGKVTTAFGAYSGRAASVAIQPDGKIVVAGTMLHPDDSPGDFALVRYNPDGSLDTGFGEEGKVTTDFWGADEDASSLVIQSDGKLVVAGTVVNPGANSIGFGLARYSPDGVLDNSFGEGGKLTTDFGLWARARSLAIQKDGKLVVAGLHYVPVPSSDFVSYIPDIAVARYHPGGSLDSSFDGDGRFTASIRDYDLVTSVALQGDGRIIVAGETRYESMGNLDMFLYRLQADGSPDTTFGERGVVIRDFGAYDFGNAVAVWGSRLYVAGAIIQEDDKGLLAAFQTGCADTEICGNRVDDDCDGQIDEGCPAMPFLTINDVAVEESAGIATLTVCLSKKVGEPVSVGYFTVDRTAVSKPHKKGGPDYEDARGTLTIPAGMQTASISIKILADQSSEGDEFFDVHLYRPEGAALSGDKGRVTIKDIAPAVTRGLAEEESLVKKLAVMVQPNPSNGYFTLALQTGSDSPVSIRVMDVLGRLVEAKAGIAVGTTLKIGHRYRPGVYYAEVVQGRERLSIRLVKQMN